MPKWQRQYESDRLGTHVTVGSKGSEYTL